MLTLRGGNLLQPFKLTVWQGEEAFNVWFLNSLLWETNFCLSIFNCWQLIHFVLKTCQEPRVCRMNKTCWTIVVFWSLGSNIKMLIHTLPQFALCYSIGHHLFCHILVLSFNLYFYHSKESSDFSLQINRWLDVLFACLLSPSETSYAKSWQTKARGPNKSNILILKMKFY